MILDLDLGQEVKESARPNFRHLSRPWCQVLFGGSDLFVDYFSSLMFLCGLPFRGSSFGGSSFGGSSFVVYLFVGHLPMVYISWFNFSWAIF